MPNIHTPLPDLVLTGFEPQKALNIFNAALVTPTYYVYFTSTTIITSTILFQGFNGSVESIITVVLGFLVICSGVILLQLSKSAKDVPDAAVFQGDLDQIHTIAEQQEPETEPKADAIRGAAGLIRRFSIARQKMEAEELRRLHEEKRAMSMDPISEDGRSQYEWDGLRRRKTLVSPGLRDRSMTSPWPGPFPRSPHPPLGMSHFPTEDEEENDRSTIFSSIAGTIRNRSRHNTTSVLSHDEANEAGYRRDKPRSPVQPVPLTEIARPGHQVTDDETLAYYGRTREQGIRGQEPRNYRSASRPGELKFAEPEYHGSSTHMDVSGDGSSIGPTPPPHSSRRQFSFRDVLRKSPGPSDEERVGLVKDDQGRPAFI